MCGARLDVQDGSSPGLTQRLCSTGVVKLRQVVDVAGPGFHNIEAVTSLLGLRSSRHTRNIINQWTIKLTSKEREMLRDYFSGADVPDEGEPFPELGLSVDQTGLGKPRWIYSYFLEKAYISTVSWLHTNMN